MISPLILVDGSSYFYRAFHALPPLNNSKGQPTGAVYGVANMVRRLIKDYNSEKIAIIFDAKGKTFRHDWYPDYKAHRPSTPDELSCQFEPLINVLKAMGLPILIIEGVEADDVIGTLAAQATAELPIIISTGDKDMAQLVNQHVSLINTMSNQTFDIEGVKAKFGVYPEQIIDYLTLIGDSVDNIPGVSKCGPKTAAKWLESYQTLDNLIANAHEITGKIGEYLRESLTHLPLSKKLITIKKDVELPLAIHQLRAQAVDQEQLLKLTRDLEFKTWVKELLATAEPLPAPIERCSNSAPFKIITSAQQLERLLTELNTATFFCVGTKTTSLDPLEAKIVGLSFALEDKLPSYIPVAHKDATAQLDRDFVLAALKPILENAKVAKLGQNLKYTYAVFKQQGIHLKGIYFDTLLESYLLNSNASRLDMDSLALKYLGYQPISYETIVGKGVKQLCFDEVLVENAAPYCAEDVDFTLKLHHKLYPLLADSVKTVLHEIEIPLIPILAEMETQGVLIDEAILFTQGERLKERIKKLEEEALALAGQSFNLNSPKQLQEILYSVQKLPILAKTPSGQPSTAEAVLQELAFDYRLPAIILEYRSLSKLVSTYIDALPKCLNKQTNRIHTSYNQAVTATGRLSSSDPNLQNIPIRGEEGRLIRKAFIAPAHHLLLAADYSQIELRIMAHLSQDPNLIHAFAQGWDIHTATASEIFQTSLDLVSHEQRRRAKAVNFGLIYGMSSFGLAKQLGIERQDAQHYIDRYFSRYPGVYEYMEHTRQQAHQQGFVETIFGRRLLLPEINARNLTRQRAAERMAINAPMQGSAADIIKKAMIAIANWQQTQQNNQLRMIMQVHDELVFEVHETAIEPTSQAIRELMEHCVKLSVPLEVSIGSGLNWDEAH